MLEKVIHIVLKAIFPPHCAGCGVSGVFICSQCTQELTYAGQECFFCGIKREVVGNMCVACKARQPLEAIVWSWRYNNIKSKNIIGAFKYKRRRAMAEVLGGVLISSLTKLDLPANTLVLAVPLHKDKLRERGFNQAELLARELPCPKSPPITARIKNTPPQARASSRSARQMAMKNAFAFTSEKARATVVGKNFLLVDDVATTGATLCEMARLLKRAGATKIYAVVLAHG